MFHDQKKKRKKKRKKNESKPREGGRSSCIEYRTTPNDKETKYTWCSQPYWRTWGAHLSNVETGIDGEMLFSKDPCSPIGLERSVHGTISSFIFLPFVMRPFSNSALCVGCRTSLRALIRGLANQFKYQRRARRNFISFPISCACVGGFNSVPAPLIPTNSPPPPRRTVTHLFAQKNAINVAVFRCTHYLRLYYCHQLLPIILVLFPISFRPHSYRSISCACSAGVRRMLRRHDVRLRYIS